MKLKVKSVAGFKIIPFVLLFGYLEASHKVSQIEKINIASWQTLDQLQKGLKEKKEAVASEGVLVTQRGRIFRQVMSGIKTAVAGPKIVDPQADLSELGVFYEAMNYADIAALDYIKKNCKPGGLFEPETDPRLCGSYMSTVVKSVESRLSALTSQYLFSKGMVRAPEEWPQHAFEIYKQLDSYGPESSGGSVYSSAKLLIKHAQDQDDGKPIEDLTMDTPRSSPLAALWSPILPLLMNSSAGYPSATVNGFNLMGNPLNPAANPGGFNSNTNGFNPIGNPLNPTANPGGFNSNTNGFNPMAYNPNSNGFNPIGNPITGYNGVNPNVNSQMGYPAGFNYTANGYNPAGCNCDNPNGNGQIGSPIIGNVISNGITGNYNVQPQAAAVTGKVLRVSPQQQVIPMILLPSSIFPVQQVTTVAPNQPLISRSVLGESAGIMNMNPGSSEVAVNTPMHVEDVAFSPSITPSPENTAGTPPAKNEPLLSSVTSRLGRLFSWSKKTQ